ncbi:MAG TPA: alpha/beta family hydrolase [Vicinamibacterales bacterium]|nr:alpha/beta family hydrolase [Vicinamibacterales bacterium]
MTHHIPGPAGRLEALIDNPAALCTTGQPGADKAPAEAVPRALVVVGHPHPVYGGTMNTKAVFQAAKAFCRLGCAVVRFNFRGAGRSEGTFSDGPGELEDFRAALDFAAGRYPGAEIWAAGVSFGAWVATTVGAEDDRVTRLLAIAPPVEGYDFGPLRTSPKPKFFIQGERDEICPTPALWQFYAHAAEPKDIVVVEAANHLFDGRLDEMAEAIERFME